MYILVIERNWMLITSCREHILVLTLISPSFHGLGMLLRASASLTKHGLFL